MPSFTHLALHVRDLDASVEFYEEFCDLIVTHRRGVGEHRVAWLAEKGRETELIFVLIAGGPRRKEALADFSHIGFACASREEVDRAARRGREASCLAWPTREEPYPVGYYCGLRDPDGNHIEMSYGQPLGPGASEGEPVLAMANPQAPPGLA